MLRTIAAAIIGVHALIHVIGFVVPWRLVEISGFAYRTTALDGALALGDGGVRTIGLVWLGLALGFGVAALAIWRSRPWAVPLIGGLAAASTVVCVLGLPDAAAGIAVNLGILTAVGAFAARTRGSVAR
jgi:hypothetical protein